MRACMPFASRVLSVLVLSSLAFACAAQPLQGAASFAQTSDVVGRTLAGAATGQDAVQLSFIILDRDGKPQMERAAHFPFYTGELFRLKALASRNGILQINAIAPTGRVTALRPMRLLAGTIGYYPESAQSVLEFANSAGQEILRVNFIPDAQDVAPATNPTTFTNPPSTVMPPSTYALPPAQAPAYQGQNAAPIPYNMPATATVSQTPPSRPSEFFAGVQGKAYAYAKDIRETVLETPQATYLVRPSGTGALSFDIVIQHRNN